MSQGIGKNASESRAGGITRLAPSPTGALHLGNARTFLINWAIARQRGWRIEMRVEDLDTPRVKLGAIEETLDILRWVGLDWDGGESIQSADLAPYRAAMRDLAERGVAYPCELTRSEIEAAASAPHGSAQTGSGESVFPASLRPPIERRAFDDEQTNWRFVVEGGAVSFEDAFAGAQSITPAETIGDFVVWTRRGQPSYQLAVVVDDAEQGVDQVVRGDDLLDSAARQLLLYRALGRAPEPTYTHLPLVRGEDGRRLAKRHGDSRLSHYRSRGCPPARVIGLIAFWCGVIDSRREIDTSEFLERFRLDTMSHDDVTFTSEDDRWLLGGS